jgi:hypothetical protein
VGSDGDTNETLERLPEYLANLKHAFVTFVGLVCPYPGTPFYSGLMSEGRLLRGVTSRDLDGYTLCHRPRNLATSELIEPFQHLCEELGSVQNVLTQYTFGLWASNKPWYRTMLLFSGPETLSLKHIVRNCGRRYIAGHDSIEAWDAKKMDEFGIGVQSIN